MQFHKTEPIYLTILLAVCNVLHSGIAVHHYGFQFAMPDYILRLFDFAVVHN